MKHQLKIQIKESVYILLETFENELFAKEYLLGVNNQDTWKYERSRETNEGLKAVYKCQR